MKVIYHHAVMSSITRTSSHLFSFHFTTFLFLFDTVVFNQQTSFLFTTRAFLFQQLNPAKMAEK